MNPKASIQTLTPYRPKVSNAHIKLDANEATFNVLEDITGNLPNNLERYPDSYSTALRKKAARFYGVKSEQIIAGNGSSEMIELTLKTFITPGDKVSGIDPSFQMYNVFSTIYGADYEPFPLNENFDLDEEKFIKYLKTNTPKVVFLCTPNNPTGKVLTKQTMENILKTTDALVIVDEAYIEFYDETESMSALINQYDHLIVLRTLSKALGLAGMRLGFLIANESLVYTLNKVKAPYNLNVITQQIGINALEKIEEARPHLEKTKTLREALYKSLKQLDLEVLESKANFIFFKSSVPNLADLLEEKSVLIRAFKGELEGYYRVTVGSKKETMIFLETLKEVL